LGRFVGTHHKSSVEEVDREWLKMEKLVLCQVELKCIKKGEMFKKQTLVRTVFDSRPFLINEASIAEKSLLLMEWLTNELL
jgi:hypothetical protein